MGIVYTGIDGRKIVSVSYSNFKREWEFTKREGKKIYAIPSNLSLVRIERAEIKSKYTLRKYMAMEIEERYGNVKWDLNLDEEFVYVVIFKGFEEPSDYFALDGEIFSLARVLRAMGRKDGIIVDFGENKTTYVEVKEGRVRNYRVVLKGGKYIDRKVSEAYGIELDEADILKREEGLKDRKVRESFEQILNSLGHDLSGKEVLLSGGLSLIKGIEDLFERGIRNPHCEPYLNTAFGSALKYIYKDKSPDFRRESIEPSDVKKFAILGGLTLSLLLFSLLGVNYGTNMALKKIKEAQKREFRRNFPNLPPVSVYEQVKALLFPREKYVLTKKWETLINKLRKDIVIYRIEYGNDRLIVKGEAKEEVVKLLEPKSIKKTPKGNIEFELEVK